ncbi:MAG: AbrB/MazE/SpoVT family DNA-binding domain-containing protein [Clostridia bacterium]
MLGFRKIKRNLPIDRYYFLRNVDELGRLVIPIEIRNELKIKENDIIELSIAEKSFTDGVDAIGRIVIPKEIRDELEIKVADKLKVYIENGNIVLENKYII